MQLVPCIFFPPRPSDSLRPPLSLCTMGRLNVSGFIVWLVDLRLGKHQFFIIVCTLGEETPNLNVQGRFFCTTAWLGGFKRDQTNALDEKAAGLLLSALEADYVTVWPFFVAFPQHKAWLKKNTRVIDSNNDSSFHFKCVRHDRLSARRTVNVKQLNRTRPPLIMLLNLGMSQSILQKFKINLILLRKI